MAELFRSERLTYRAIEEGDEAIILTMHKNTELSTRCGYFPVPHGLKSAKEYRGYLDTCLMAAMICLPTATPHTTSPTMVPIGTITLSDSVKERKLRNSVVTVVIAPAYQRHGYGSEAMRWALNWAFQRAGLHKVSMWCYEYNNAAMGLYERFSFTPEARLREHVWMDGKFWDDCGFSILEPEWRDRYRATAALGPPPSGFVNFQRPTFQPINSTPMEGIQDTQTSGSVAAGSLTSPMPLPGSAQPSQDPIFRRPSSRYSGASPRQRTASTPHTYESPIQTADKRRQKSAATAATSYSTSPPTSSSGLYPWPGASSDPSVVYEYRTLKDSTVTVAELWKEWHDGYPEEGRPSVEWMEAKYKGNWRKKQHGAPGASCQYFSQRKRVIDEVKRLADVGGLGSYEAAIEHLDARMRREGMPSLNKLANELKRESGVQKRKRYERDSTSSPP